MIRIRYHPYKTAEIVFLVYNVAIPAEIRNAVEKPKAMPLMIRLFCLAFINEENPPESYKIVVAS